MYEVSGPPCIMYNNIEYLFNDKSTFSSPLPIGKGFFKKCKKRTVDRIFFYKYSKILTNNTIRIDIYNIIVFLIRP